MLQRLLSHIGRLFEPPQAAPVLPRIDASGAPFTIPVLVINYFPVKNARIDRRVTGDVDAPLDQLRQHTAQTTARVIDALEQGSAYHHYKNPQAKPSLRYQIVETLEFLEPLPVWSKPGHRVPMTDYNAIMQRINIHDLGRATGRKGNLAVGLSRRRDRFVGIEHGGAVWRHQQQ